MRRPDKPLPLPLRSLRHNPETGLYEIEENGISYKMSLEETRDLQDFFRASRGAYFPTVAEWYKATKPDIRKRVAREGNIPATEPGEDGFYPDPDWPE